MVTRAALQTERERGVDPAQSRLVQVAQAAEAAYGAATLEDAQVILAGAIPSLATSMSLSAPFDSPAGSSPQTTATRTITVPSGNPGMIHVDVLGSDTATLTYSLAGGADVEIDIVSFGGLGFASADFAVADTNSLDFKLVGVNGQSVALTVKDATTGETLSSSGITLT